MANSTGHGGSRPNTGGKREGAGRPPGITGPGTGRPPGAVDKTLAPSRVVPTAQKWEFAERALQHADTMLNVLVNLALNAKNEAVRMASADKVIDRAMGKAPQHFDVTAMRHTDIVYSSAEELRREVCHLADNFLVVVIAFSLQHA